MRTDGVGVAAAPDDGVIRSAAEVFGLRLQRRGIRNREEPSGQ